MCVLRFFDVLHARCTLCGLNLYGFGAGFIISVGKGFLRVFLPVMLLGGLSSSD